jgi:hypothetical protein
LVWLEKDGQEVLIAPTTAIENAVGNPALAFLGLTAGFTPYR